MNYKLNRESKRKIILIDGYAGAGKSTCVEIFRDTLGKEFTCINRYTTRERRLDENENVALSDCVFLTTRQFLEKSLDFVFYVEGVYYGISKKEILDLLETRHNLFLIANEYFRKQILKHFGQIAEIKQIFVQTSKCNRISRIENANDGARQTDLRLRKLNANRQRTETDFDFIINNDSSIMDLKKKSNPIPTYI